MPNDIEEIDECAGCFMLDLDCPGAIEYCEKCKELHKASNAVSLEIKK